MPQMFNPVPFPGTLDEKRSGASSVEPAVSSSSSVASSLPAVDDRPRASEGKSDGGSAVGHGNELTPNGGAPSQSVGFDSPATTIASSRGDSALTSLNNSPAKAITSHDKLPHIEDGLSSQSESEVEAKSATRAPDAENPTAALIKKQMHEIEKEINRRMNNQNVKKIDQHEIEQLLS
uniref:Uncharacterized protein n=1 Tax=Plectus sambesii TaxID=2011161 RepID=A0A914V5S0_9BILA